MLVSVVTGVLTSALTTPEAIGMRSPADVGGLVHTAVAMARRLGK